MSRRSRLIVLRSFAVAAGLVLAAACTDEEVGVQDGPHLLAASFNEDFRIGDDPSERPFTRISSMAFAPNGHLVVIDRDAFTVVVLDRDGREVLEWGGQGEGPGEFENEPEIVTVSAEGNVAVSSFRRVDVFTPNGILIGPHLLDNFSVDAIMFDRDGYVVAEVSAGSALFSNEPAQNHLMRLRDREILRSFPQPGAGNGIRFFFPYTITAALEHDRIAAGVNNRYEIDVLDSSDGQVLGHITRPVTGP